MPASYYEYHKFDTRHGAAPPWVWKQDSGKGAADRSGLQGRA